MSEYTPNALDKGDFIKNIHVDNWDEASANANNAYLAKDNLLNNDLANCDTVTGLTASGCSVAMDTTEQASGLNCIKTTLSSATGTVDIDILSLLDVTATSVKYYMLSAKLKNGDATNLTLSFETDVTDGDVTGDAVTATTYTRDGIVIAPDNIRGATSATLRITVTGASSEIVYFDESLLREISAPDYALAEADLLSKYVL